ncbi:MAG: phosphoglucosamine mutase [Deltaproteobacteria bacterium]|nr:phosphoglucosamine mutase [Deltaproteobacteria bacterium]
MKSQKKLFGTDGIRGPANIYPLTGEVAMALGRALTYVARKNSGRQSPKIVIGKDTRLSGYMLETAISSGICSMGGQVMLVGPLPTPGISFITSSMRADAGVVISASHNPFEDNGIKIFWADGYKLPDEVELELEKLILDPQSMSNKPVTGENIGRAVRIDDAVGRYIVELKHTFPRDYTLEGINIVLDCANGAAYKTAPSVFKELGANVDLLAAAPDGKNINEGCGALHPKTAAKRVVKKGADIGITLDGDADRVILIDEKGNIVDGDAVMAMCAVMMIKDKTLAKKCVVTTVMSNIGLDKAVQDAGGKVVRTDVGDRYVVEEMRKHGYNFGGEQSGHLIFTDHSTTGDGVLAALQIMAIMVKEKKTLSELATGIMKRVPQSLLSFKVPKKVPLSKLSKVNEVIKSIEKTMGKEGRVLVRYSGTEAKARVLVEGPNQKQIDEYSEKIKATLIAELS